MRAAQAAILVQHDGVAIDDVGFGMVVKFPLHGGQRAWHQRVIDIQPVQDIAVQLAPALGDGGGLAAVRAVAAIGEQIAERVGQIGYARVAGRVQQRHREGAVDASDGAQTAPPLLVMAAVATATTASSMPTCSEVVVPMVGSMQACQSQRAQRT